MKSTEPLPLSEIDVAENEPGPVMVWLPIAPSWLAAGIAGATGIGSVTFAFAVHEPEVLGLPPKLVALVPMFPPHAFASTQLVGSVHAVLELYAPVELFQLSIVPFALKLVSANAAFVKPGIGHPAAETRAVASSALRAIKQRVENPMDAILARIPRKRVPDGTAVGYATGHRQGHTWW